MMHKINVMLGENQRFIDDKQGEHDKKIKGDNEILSHLVNDFLLQRLLGITHGDLFLNGLTLGGKAVLSAGDSSEFVEYERHLDI